jgi:hypothetical protein
MDDETAAAIGHAADAIKALAGCSGPGDPLLGRRI